MQCGTDYTIMASRNANLPNFVYEQQYFVYKHFKQRLNISAITFEYLKAEIVNISKPYLQNLPLK